MKLVKLTAPLVAAVCLVGVALAGDLKSGLQVGDGPPPFDVRNVTGTKCEEPAKDERLSLCYRCKFSAYPTACVFTRKIDENVTGLVKQIDAALAKDADKKSRAFVVLITDDADGAAKQLEKLAEKEKIKNVPLTLVEGPTGPPEYKIAKEAEVTVLMWNGPVKYNHAFAKGELKKDKIAAVLADFGKLAEKADK